MTRWRGECGDWDEQQCPGYSRADLGGVGWHCACGGSSSDSGSVASFVDATTRLVMVLDDDDGGGGGRHCRPTEFHYRRKTDCSSC